jgi:hypothetical protein
MSELFENKSSGAAFSDCRNYRYALWRIWNRNLPLVMFIGLNPSTANESEPDNTIRRVKSISENLGYGGFYMMNCFPIISTDPKILKDTDKTVFDQQQYFINNQKLKEVTAKCKDIIFAWGNFKEVQNRAKEVQLMFPNAKALHINKNGSPKHPLYCRKDIQPVNFSQEQLK